jgi:nicotinamide-nucleotide amidase
MAPRVAILTVGDEILTGDIANTNARWLARELEKLGMRVRIIATVSDERESIAAFVRWGSRENDAVIVTGGLGGTPDDVTRTAIADAFGVERKLDRALAAELERAGGHAAVFAHEWAYLPRGSRVLGRVPGGAPAFAVRNVYALAGVPAEMRASFRAIRAELSTGTVRGTWRKTYPITEDQILALLRDLNEQHADVAVGSYPTYGASGPEVEVVLRAWQDEALAAAAAHLEQELAGRGIRATDVPSARRTKAPS